MRILTLSYTIVFGFLLATDSALTTPEETPDTPLHQEEPQP